MTRKRGHNEGTYYQLPSGRWRAQISIGGKRIGTTKDTRQEAIGWIRKTLGQIDKGLSFQATRVTISEYMDFFLNSTRGARRESTWLAYKKYTELHILPALGDIKLKDLRPEHIQVFYNKTHKEKSAWVVTKLNVILHQALQHAVKLGLIPSNPASHVIVPRPKQEEMRILDEGEVKQLLGAARNTRYAGLLHLAIVTGMRMGELLGLKWDDLDWESKVLRVERQVEARTRNMVSPKTRHGRRVIALGDKTIRVLRKHQEKQEMWRMAKKKRWQENNLIFPTTIGTPMAHRNLLRDFKQILNDAGLPDYRFHDLRHTAAALMLNHGVPLIIVSRRLGHSRASITLDLYGHLVPSLQADAAEKIDEIVY